MESLWIGLGIGAALLGFFGGIGLCFYLAGLGIAASDGK